MNERKTLRQWMIEMGYKWEPGRERLMKAEITRSEAEQELNSLMKEGVVRRG